MAAVDGVWWTSTLTPMGAEQATLKVTSAGASWSGMYSGTMGVVTITNGTVNGNEIAWTMVTVAPQRTSIACAATITGDTLDGSMEISGHGTFRMTGYRTG